jgi:hypothetical protein
VVGDNERTGGNLYSGDQEIKSAVQLRSKMDSTMTTKVWERIPQSAREKRPDASDFTSIPTEDPRAALQFCRSLAHMLAGGSNPSLKLYPSGPNRRRDSSCTIYSRTSTGLSVVIPVFNNDHGFRVQPVILVAQPVCGSALS